MFTTRVHCVWRGSWHMGVGDGRMGVGRVRGVEEHRKSRRKQSQASGQFLNLREAGSQMSIYLLLFGVLPVNEMASAHGPVTCSIFQEKDCKQACTPINKALCLWFSWRLTSAGQVDLEDRIRSQLWMVLFGETGLPTLYNTAHGAFQTLLFMPSNNPPNLMQRLK